MVDDEEGTGKVAVVVVEMKHWKRGGELMREVYIGQLAGDVDDDSHVDVS